MAFLNRWIVVLDMIDDIIKVAGIVDFFYPKEWKNIKVDFKIKEIGLRFICDDKNLGDFRVRIYDLENNQVAYIEGKNHRGSKIKIGHNSNKYSKDFLYNCFHMSRCNREFERLSDINYSKGFDYFRNKVINQK